MRSKLRQVSVFVISLFTAAACHLLPAAAEPEQAQPRKITIDTAGGRPISPYIFGFGSYMHDDRKQTGAWQQRPALYRWGGNSAERFNWKVNATNAGSDYFFLNHGFDKLHVVDDFIAENQRHHSASAIVLPLLGWVAKDDASASYPKEAFPTQQQWEPNRKAFGNGLDPAGRRLATLPTRTSVAAGPALITAWVQHLKTRFGTYPHFYILGNEPMLWGETHRDVHPQPTTYDEYLAIYLAAATAVRKADPQAVIIGPADWGWLPVFQSQLDRDGQPRGKDRKAHGDQPLLEWFLRGVQAREAQLHTSLLDILDMHYYPSDLSLYKDEAFNAGVAKTRIAATRSLWDLQHKEGGWINQEVAFLPLLKGIIARTKPTLQLAIGEYSFKGEQDLGGAIALAEALRLFVEHGVYMAEYWTDPAPGSPAAAAFQLYRNYNGAGGAFGGTYLPTDHDSGGDLAVVAARVDAHRLTVILINKSTTAYQRPTLVLNHLKSFVTTATGYTLSSQDPSHLRPASLPAGRELRVALAPLSAMLIEFRY